jgi:hypothetical protein
LLIQRLAHPQNHTLSVLRPAAARDPNAAHTRKKEEVAEGLGTFLLPIVAVLSGGERSYIKAEIEATEVQSRWPPQPPPLRPDSRRALLLLGDMHKSSSTL